MGQIVVYSYEFKAKDSEIVQSLLFLGNTLKD